MRNEVVIFDTSIFIDEFRSGRHQLRIQSFAALIRTSSVVLSELWRGAATSAERAILRNLEKNHPVLTPTERIWLESGELLGRMRMDHGFEKGKLRDLHFDLLIALTARACGARLVSSDRADFEMIQHYRAFRLEVW